MKHFAFVESNTTGTGALAVERLLEAGHGVTFLANRRSRYPFLQGQRSGLQVREIDTNDEEVLERTLRELHGEEPIFALLTFSEFYVETVARLARRLGYPGLDPRAAESCRNKDRTRRTLHEAGLPVPQFELVDEVEKAVDAARRIGLPVVIKPPADSSSFGVRRVETLEEVEEQFREIAGWTENVRHQPLRGQVLVEELLTGSEHSVETMTLGAGEHRVLGVVDKYLGDPPWFVETGHDFPSRLPEDRRQALQEAALAALDAVGFDYGPAHTEIKWTSGGPVVVEINPRMAGGLIPELIRAATGLDLLGMWLTMLSRETPSWQRDRSGHASIRFLTAPRHGELEALDGLAEARAVEGVLSVETKIEPGLEVRPARSTYDRLGHVIAAGGTAQAVDRALAAALQRLHFRYRRQPAEMGAGG